MEMNPQRVRSAEFKTVRKGADLDEVRTFLDDVADELERAQNQSAAMEARARAAVARLQEMNEGAAAAPKVDASVEESETISRTLLLAQRTADSTVAEAQAEAAKVLADAKDEAARTIDSTREMSAQLLEEARVEARKQGVAERQSIASEVEALKARRDFLESDVHQLETFLVDQRSRVREAASALLDVADRVPGGLAEVRAPLLSASDDEPGDDGAEVTVDAAASDLLIVPADAGADAPVEETADGDPTPSDGMADADEMTGDDEMAGDDVGDGVLDDSSWAPAESDTGDETEAMPAFGRDADEQSDPSGEEFRFSFDDERS